MDHDLKVRCEPKADVKYVAFLSRFGPESESGNVIDVTLG